MTQAYDARTVEAELKSSLLVALCDAFVTSTAGPGGHYVTLKYRSLQSMQDAHDAIINFRALPVSPVPTTGEASEPSPLGDVERWIADMFSGHAVAIRRQDDPPIPGEPFMSMAAAKDICRAALTASRSSNDDEERPEVIATLFSGPAVRSSNDEIVEVLECILKCTPLVIDGEVEFDCGDPFDLARDLLSKVKEQG